MSPAFYGAGIGGTADISVTRFLAAGSPRTHWYSSAGTCQEEYQRLRFVPEYLRLAAVGALPAHQPDPAALTAPP